MWKIILGGYIKQIMKTILKDLTSRNIMFTKDGVIT